MALFKEKLPLQRSACITATDTREEIQDKSSNVQAKVNRLKRQKKAARTETDLKLCSEASTSAQECRAAAKTSTKNVNESGLGPRKEGSGLYSPSEVAFPSNRPPKQSNVNMRAGKASCVRLNEASSRLSTVDPEPDITDHFGDEEKKLHKWSHEQVSVVIGGHVERSGRREPFSDETCEELLEQIQAQNRRFAVRQFFSLLLKQRELFEKSLTGFGMITKTPSAPVSGKRKPDTVLHVNQPLKRQRWSGELSRDGVSAPQCVNTHSPHSSRSNPSSRSRLSVSRRRKQQNTTPFDLLQPSQSVCFAGEHAQPECVTKEDVLWTEKYQPQHSSGIVGNSASMRKLHSWLKEWRMRTDVEERRRRQEERRRKQEENRETWDTGDFVGESVMACEAELCNTVLIVGPGGVGKTAAVYACAQELGYKVFEVNGASLRSGQLVVSQLREATQSHQVGALQPDSLTPQNSLSTNTVRPPAPAAALGEKVSRRATGSCRKSSRSIPRKKGTAQARNIKHFFKRTDGSVNRSDDLQQDPNNHASDSVRPDVLIECGSNANCPSKEHVLNTEDHQLDRRNRTPLISLILFEEVDIIFSEDVGFLSAIKTLMTTTKRPIILTTNDALFSKNFNGHFEVINFKTPPLEITRTYLQCMCVVEGVWPHTEDISFFVDKCKGDVRRSVLELELWVRSGRGTTPRHTLNKTLACSSWDELESRGFVDVLVENWRMGCSLFYSNLELLFVSPYRTTENVDKNMLNASSSSVLNESRTGKPSRLKGSKLEMTNRSFSKYASVSMDRSFQSSSPVTWTAQSESASAEERSSKLVSCCLNSLAQCFDTMSFLDSCIYTQQWQVSGQCQPGPLGWMGAQLTDSLVDELREEEMNTHLESSYELLSVLEGLGFHQCRAKLSEVWQTVEKLKEEAEDERFAQLMDALNTSKSSNTSVSQNKPCKHSVVQKSGKEVLNKVLSSKAFCCHGNRKAVAMDYLPALRSICRLESLKQQTRPRFTHYLNAIRLPLPGSLLQLLASDLH